LASPPALAQLWIDYVNPEYRFAVNFPVEPEEVDIAYRGADSANLPARSFTAEQGTSFYRVTVVLFSDGAADGLNEIEHAAQTLRARGEAIYDRLSEYDGVPAHELSLIGRGGRQTLATILFHDGRLFIAEGNVDADAFPPVQFQQSIYVIDADGVPINLR
jgi:hypothetical protein